MQNLSSKRASSVHRADNVSETTFTKAENKTFMNQLTSMNSITGVLQKLWQYYFLCAEIIVHQHKNQWKLPNIKISYYHLKEVNQNKKQNLPYNFHKHFHNNSAGILKQNSNPKTIRNEKNQTSAKLISDVLIRERKTKNKRNERSMRLTM